MTKSFTPDPTAAAVHRARAERAYQDAEKFRKLGLTKSEQLARDAARNEDETAELLSYGKCRR
jgi:hypothetical protein